MTERVEVLPVSEAAREAAAALHLEIIGSPHSEADLFEAEMLRAGDSDDWPEVQAFARFEARLSSQSLPVEVRKKVEPRPYPYATGEGTKYSEYFGFEDGSLTICTSGFGEKTGTGWLCFPEAALEQEQNDETGEWYWIANLANSELIFIRDTLNQIFPSALASPQPPRDEMLAERVRALTQHDPLDVCAGLSDHEIEAGQRAWDYANDAMREREQTADPSGMDDWDEGMIVAAIFKAVARAALNPSPPDDLGAKGLYPDGAPVREDQGTGDA